MAIRVCWGHMEPHFGGKGRSQGSAMAPFERAVVVSYRLSIVTVVLCVTIRPQFAIECTLFRKGPYGRTMLSTTAWLSCFRSYKIVVHISISLIFVSGYVY